MTARSYSCSAAASSDPDGDPLSYAWTQTSGPAATIADSNQAASDVTLPQVNAPTTLVFQLTATDPAGAASADSVAVTVNDVSNPNNAPIANAGADTSGNEGSRISFSGAASSDPDGDPLSFSWLQTLGPSA